MNAAKSKQNTQEVEISPDAWARFERAVDVVAKSPPQHKSKSKKSSTKTKNKNEKT
jgi:hypothetical protein